ncbi:hypothetical protein KIF53_20455 [Chromobacterium subtsugae]|uniref:Uncharacterized protein n=1 Tax=Chromobacterium subtsugae TaxID=251747 RepID=A0ABS7FIV9_9NEIS|nr:MULTISPECIES: hypothetical protein [Chromobacterium]KZE86512.1 hypothetical protein AWB61_15360 [Chromobacterium sp. F49]MBW7568972.1 hypothetical protein [Chromobacterium subtsugae]MBW8290015.1 hypothetical protein [Chromobacterium subtsugae]WSE92974.1 hypothetical protein U6115_06955 [Chromobacterium subtsugae]WVH61352.1 hypothetical protein U6151_06975 [Chromobacterium subtsugae]
MTPRRAWTAALLLTAAAAGGAVWRLWPAQAPSPPPAVAKRPAAILPTRPIVHQATPAQPWRPPARPALPPVKKGGNSWRPEAAPVAAKVEVQRGAPDMPDAQPLPRPPDP